MEEWCHRSDSALIQYSSWGYTNKQCTKKQAGDVVLKVPENKQSEEYSGE